MTLWSGRTGVEPDPLMMAFSDSLAVDRRLAGDDVRASIAHVHGLARAGVLSADEADALADALRRVGEELSSGRFAFAAGDEDIHTAIERRVTEVAGDTGARLHTGRSRNDQVATALRLYTRRELAVLGQSVLDLQSTLLERAREVGQARLPGYTHTQRAQPVLFAHHLLAHGWSLGRDVDRICDALARVDVSPLGAGALAGSSLPLDPDATAAELGFAHRFENSMDAVSDRDFVAETLFVCALLGVHLSRLGEEVVLFSTEEFGFYRLDGRWATGSSMLPQKMNADVGELARGKAGRLVGHLAGFLTTLKGLPLSYNRDLQEDKEPLFDALDQATLASRAMRGLLASVAFDFAAMQTAADAPVLAAVDLAEWLVERGTPFRRAHGIVGALVRASLEHATPLVELVARSADLGPEAAELLRPGAASARRRTAGGAGTDAVAEELERFASALRTAGERLAPRGETG